MNTSTLGVAARLETRTQLNGATYFPFISRWMRELHAAIPCREFDVTRLARPIDIREEHFEGVNYKRAVIYLMSNGCEWALKAGNGCTMCGHLSRHTRKEEPIAADDYLKQFRGVFDQIDFRRCPLLDLYNNGSFLNRNEIPHSARTEMLKLINRNPDIRMLVLESRPEYIDQETIDDIHSLVPNKHVEIAIGLELKDDLLRSICVNKGFVLAQYNQAAKLITSKLKLRTYVMLKPPFLTEKEGIEEAVRAVEHAFAAGTTTVSLEACTIQAYTLAQYLAERNRYRPPWLWSIAEVVRRTAHLGKLVVGLFQFYPSPTIVPYNCDRCSHRVLEAIKTYNRTLDLGALRGLTCECRKAWGRELRQVPRPFEERVSDAVAEWETRAREFCVAAGAAAAFAARSE